MHHEKRNPVALAGTNRVEEEVADKADFPKDSDWRGWLQLLSAFGLAAAISVVVVAVTGGTR